MTRTSVRTRASALPVDERRAAIVDAALPIFLDRGGAVTSREVAEAAGIAEGTIFRVFADKQELLAAIVDAALDTTPTEAALAAIDPSLPFDAQIEAAVDILRARVLYVFRVISAAANAGQGRKGVAKHAPPELRELEALFARASSHLRCPPAQASHLLRGLTFAATHPSFVGDDALTSSEITSVLLDGIRSEAGGGSAC
jgi:AcrR family transcriptional regulator